MLRALSLCLLLSSLALVALRGADGGGDCGGGGCHPVHAGVRLPQPGATASVPLSPMPLPSLSPPPLFGHVLSGSAARWPAVRASLRACGITPVRETPVELGADHCASNRETHKRIWRALVDDAGAGEREWTLVFEDDAVLVPGVDPRAVPAIVRAAAALAENSSGLFYLGLCIHYGGCRGAALAELANVSIGECRGQCTHAYGVFKWRARTLAADAESAAISNGMPSCYLDAMLYQLYTAAPPEAPWSILAGANIIIRDMPPVGEHRGIFDQNQAFPSLLTPAPPDAADPTPTPRATTYPDDGDAAAATPAAATATAAGGAAVATAAPSAALFEAEAGSGAALVAGWKRALSAPGIFSLDSLLAAHLIVLMGLVWMM